MGTNGGITINGVAEVIDPSLAAALGVGTTLNTALNAIALADATTCLDVTAGPGGVITGLTIAANAQVCGEVALNTLSGLTSVGGVVIPTTVLTANAGLSAFLAIALNADADICVDLITDTTTGLIVGAAVNAEFDVCGTVEVDGAGNATVGGVAIPASLMDADAAAALRLAALVDAIVCVTVDGNTTGTTTTVDIGVTATICATVTAVGNGTLTLEGITLNVAGNATAGVEVGDEVCVAMAPAADGGNPITSVNSGAAAPGAGGTPAAGGVRLLPDTAMDTANPVRSLVLGLLLIGLALGLRLRRLPTR